MEQIRVQLKAYREQTGKSLADVERELGVSTATLSKIENGKFDKISGEMVAKIKHYLGMDKEWQLAETKAYRAIMAQCAETQSEATISVVLGYTGSGKTTTCKQYQKGNKGVYFISCDAEMSKKEFLQEIADVLGIKGSYTRFGLIKQIGIKLKDQLNPLLIIDEAGKLRKNMMTLIQSIYTAADEKVGIVLVGVDYFYDNLMKAVKKEAVGMPELERRISSDLHIKTAPNRAEIKAIAIANGVKEADIKAFMQNEISNFGDLFHAVKKWITTEKQPTQAQIAPDGN